MNKKISILIFLIFILTNNFIFAQEQKVELYFFWGDGCPHCAKAKPFINELSQKYSNLSVYSLEVYYNQENNKLFQKKLLGTDLKQGGVPTFFINDKYIIGFDSVETTGAEIENLVKNTFAGNNQEKSTVINLPIFGQIDYSKISLLLFTIVIGLVDGFNPCAMWVLCFLLTLLVYTKSRKKMFLVGGIFILVSGIVYFMFMTAWLQIISFMRYRVLIQWLIGLIAIIMAVINIKDFFWFKKGVSLSISDKYKPKIFEKMRNLVHSQALIAILIGTVSLAFFVNLIELACTAGLPNLYVTVLEFNKVSSWQRIMYLILYNVMYMLDDLLIFAIAVITLSSKKIQEKEGRWLKLVSGIIIGILGLVMIINPELLMFG